jgi:signal transduction histidine kinase
MEALQAWRADHTDLAVQGITRAVAVAADAVGATGGWIHLDGDGSLALEAGSGLLRDGPRAAQADVATEAVEVGAAGQMGRVAATGDPAARGALIHGLSLALRSFGAQAGAEANDQRLEALDDATRAIAGELDLERVLQVIVDRVRPLVGARYAALGIVGPAGRFERFITSGITDEERARIGQIPIGLGLLGHVIQVGHAVRVVDLGTDPRRHGFPPNHPLMRTFLGAPVTVTGTSVGNLYLTEKRQGGTFTDADERLVATFARHAAIAIERARLHEQVGRLAIVDERDRISRDLHDGIIQSLYAVSLSLEEVPELMDRRPDEARSIVDGAVDSIHDAIRDIRNFIVGLRPEALGGGELADALAGLGREARQHGFDDVVVTIDDAAVVSPLLATDIVQVAREVISNAVRHADARRLEIRLGRDLDAVVLSIRDDGRGFDPGELRSADHRGLANLEARARRMGADLAIETAPGAGTCVTLTVSRRTG